MCESRAGKRGDGEGWSRRKKRHRAGQREREWKLWERDAGKGFKYKDTEACAVLSY